MHRLLVAIVLLGLIAACKSETPSGMGRHSKGDMASITEVTFSVAASTRDVIQEIIEPFQSSRPVKVHVNSGASNALATQIVHGAPVDLFLSASPTWANYVADAGLAKRSIHLLTNRLVIVVPKGNPAAVHLPKDLLSPGVLKVALAGESVPAGQYADQALSNLDILDTLREQDKIVRGQDVRTALSYVERGEAEAGIVYATDAALSELVTTVHEFDPGLHDEIVYVLVLLNGAEGNEMAESLASFLESPQATERFIRYGFQPMVQQRT
ncbi:MAG: molybdate ABC transporter substrate-binding protein, partial [Pirellula sp.]|nr:molybdate ABC transporter substrate-binding protein [Pirellula sp.]